MRQRLLQFNKTHRLFKDSDRILVAVSGGRDSMALAHLLKHIGLDIGLAHVNYHLRGVESDADQALVESFADRHELTVHVEHAPIEAKAGSIQLIARNQRYAYFNLVAEQFGYDKVALAHHADDRLESLFLNLLRGTGIHGLKGMPVSSEHFIRPILWARRQEIDDYIKQHSIPFRDDATNEGDAYLRNRVRHHLIPLVEEIDPTSINKLLTSFDALAEDGSMVEHLAESFLENDGNAWKVHLTSLPTEDRASWLYHTVRTFGFNRAQCVELLSPPHSGKRVENGRFELRNDQGILRITSKSD